MVCCQIARAVVKKTLIGKSMVSQRGSASKAERASIKTVHDSAPGGVKSTFFTSFSLTTSESQLNMPSWVVAGASRGIGVSSHTLSVKIDRIAYISFLTFSSSSLSANWYAKYELSSTVAGKFFFANDESFCQSLDANNTVVGLVRNKDTAKNLLDLQSTRQNVHVVQADVTDRKALQVSVCLHFAWLRTTLTASAGSSGRGQNHHWR